MGGLRPVAAATCRREIIPAVLAAGSDRLDVIDLPTGTTAVGARIEAEKRVEDEAVRVERNHAACPRSIRRLSFRPPTLVDLSLIHI